MAEETPPDAVALLEPSARQRYLEARVISLSTRLSGLESHFNTMLRLQIDALISLASVMENLHQRGDSAVGVEEYSHLVDTIDKMLDRYKLMLDLTLEHLDGE